MGQLGAGQGKEDENEAEPQGAEQTQVVPEDLPALPDGPQQHRGVGNQTGQHDGKVIDQTPGMSFERGAEAGDVVLEEEPPHEGLPLVQVGQQVPGQGKGQKESDPQGVEDQP